MTAERILARLVRFIGGISWLLRLNARLKDAARRFRPIRVLLATLAEVTRNDAQQLNAGIAYYGMVALLPVTVAMLQILALTLGEERSRGWLASYSSALLPLSIDLQGLLSTQDATAAGVTGLLALLGLAWGSFRLFGAVGVVVNRMWGISPRQVGVIAKTRQYLLMSATALVLLIYQRPHLPDVPRPRPPGPARPGTRRMVQYPGHGHCLRLVQRNRRPLVRRGLPDCLSLRSRTPRPLAVGVVRRRLRRAWPLQLVNYGVSLSSPTLRRRTCSTAPSPRC